MSTEPNAVCAVCGSKYKICLSCRNTARLTPWRAIADTAGCYKIYMVIHDYTNHKISKKRAGELLKNCAVPSKLQAHIKAVIDEITESEENGPESNPNRTIGANP